MRCDHARRGVRARLGVAGVLVTAVMCGACASNKSPAAGSRAADTDVQAAAPLAITGGETFTIESKILGEARRINVLVPTVYGQKIDEAMPVLYMPDGGMDEDFLHIAGLV
ncbi:MAG: hypothetical protein U0638_06785 [Phycisphaerales bacterium]